MCFIKLHTVHEVYNCHCICTGSILSGFMLSFWPLQHVWAALFTLWKGLSVCSLVWLVGCVSCRLLWDSISPERSSEGYSPWSVFHTLMTKPARFFTLDRPPPLLVQQWWEVVCRGVTVFSLPLPLTVMAKPGCWWRLATRLTGDWNTFIIVVLMPW